MRYYSAKQLLQRAHQLQSDLYSLGDRYEDKKLAEHAQCANDAAFEIDITQQKLKDLIKLEFDIKLRS